MGLITRCNLPYPPFFSQGRSFFTHRTFALLALALPLVLGGCEKVYLDYAETQAHLGDTRVANGEYADAILAYEAALNGTPESAALHLKIGLIYDDHLDDPVSAAHHFQRYLLLAPNGSRRGDAEAFIKEDQLKLITRMGHGAIMPQAEAVRLKNENMRLREQVLGLQGDLERASRERAAILKSMGKTAAKQFGSKQVKKELVPGVRTHVVQRGDTLASLSRKYYKRPANWKRIQDANFGPMDGPATLQIGMELMIP